jgi:hypothetical protein
MPRRFVALTARCCGLRSPSPGWASRWPAAPWPTLRRRWSQRARRYPERRSSQLTKPPLRLPRYPCSRAQLWSRPSLQTGGPWRTVQRCCRARMSRTRLPSAPRTALRPRFAVSRWRPGRWGSLPEPPAPVLQPSMPGSQLRMPSRQRALTAALLRRVRRRRWPVARRAPAAASRRSRWPRWPPRGPRASGRETLQVGGS